MSEQAGNNSYPKTSEAGIEASDALNAQFEAGGPFVGVDELPLVPKIMDELRGFAAKVAPRNAWRVDWMADEGELFERYKVFDEAVEAKGFFQIANLTIRSPKGEPNKIIIQYPREKTPEEEALHDSPYEGPASFQTELEMAAGAEGVRVKTMINGHEDGFPSLGHRVYNVLINDPEDCQRLLDFLGSAPDKLITEEDMAVERASEPSPAFDPLELFGLEFLRDAPNGAAGGSETESQQRREALRAMRRYVDFKKKVGLFWT